jgi:chromosome partitioning protein
MPNTQNKPKIISVFNNKGGVGKTTYLYHLAHLLAESGKKVLCVDCDSQCNLTAYFLRGSKFDGSEISNKENEKFGNLILNHSIFNLIRGIFAGQGFDQNITPIDKSHNLDNKNGKIAILPGSMQLSILEDELGNSFSGAMGGGHLAITIQTAIYRSVLELAQRGNFDCVFFDLGPNMGALNRSIIPASDYFIVPVSPDLFSILGTENLGNRLLQWADEWSLVNMKYQSIKQFLPPAQEMKIPNGKPNFLGYIVQMFSADSHGDMARTFDNFARQFDPAFKKNIIDKLTKNNQVFKGGLCDYNLGQIPNMDTAVPASMLNNCPMYKLRGLPGVAGPTIAKGEQIKAMLKPSVNRVMEILK